MFGIRSDNRSGFIDATNNVVCVSLEDKVHGTEVHGNPCGNVKDISIRNCDTFNRKERSVLISRNCVIVRRQDAAAQLHCCKIFHHRIKNRKLFFSLFIRSSTMDVNYDDSKSIFSCSRMAQNYKSIDFLERK